MAQSYGIMMAVRDGDAIRFVTSGLSSPNARTGRAAVMARALLAEPVFAESLPHRYFVLIQYADYTEYAVGSVGYCRRRGTAPAVRLIPDTFFFESEGYRAERAALAGGALPRWQDRQDRVFWRGSSTYYGLTHTGALVEQVEQIPRVAMCLALRDHPLSDVAIMSAWGFHFPPDAVVERLTAEGVYRPSITMLEHAAYRYLIDIDGVANAWSFFQKLLLGCCVLKVASPFEQWFYGSIEAWTHFVPVREDLSDLVEKIEWCHSHQAEAQAIAEAGQNFAAAHSFPVAMDLARKAWADCAVAF